MTQFFCQANFFRYPFYQKTLSVVEIREKAISPGYVCQITKTTTLVIPRWMIQPDAEVFCSVQESPQG